MAELSPNSWVCTTARWGVRQTGLGHSTCQHMQKTSLVAGLMEVIGVALTRLRYPLEYIKTKPVASCATKLISSCETWV